MGNGMDRAGYKQGAGVVDAILIGPSTGSTDGVNSSDYNSNGWCQIRVISSKAVFAAITAPGMTNSSKFTSGTSWNQDAIISCNQITYIKLSCKTTGHAVIAYDKILL